MIGFEAFCLSDLTLNKHLQGLINKMDKELERAVKGWNAFTQLTTISVVVIIAILGLMALFLL
jgi:hypothetical protein